MVPISPEIYSSTAVVMDNRSLSDYISKLEDRRLKRAAAEQEAFDAWNEANEKSLNPSNMRNQELEAFNKGLQEYRMLAIEAKRAPKDYTKRMAAQKKADELLALARESKNAKEVDKEYTNLIRATLNNPEARNTTDYQAILKDKAIHDLPIGWKAGGLMGVPELKRPTDTAPKMDYYKPPPVDVVELFNKNSSGVKLGAGVRTSPTDKDFFYTETSTYTPEGIKSIAERAADKVANNPNLLSSYRVKGQQLSTDQAAQMTVALKKYFPNMQVDDEDPISVVMADMVIEGERRKEEKKIRDAAAFARYQSNLIEGRGGGQRQKINLSDYDLLKNYSTKIQTIDLVKEGKTKEERTVTPIEVVLEKDIGAQDKELITNKGDISPIKEGGRSYFIVRADGNWEGSGGKVIDRANVARANLDKTSLSEEKRGALNLRQTLPQVPVFKGIPQGGF